MKSFSAHPVSPNKNTEWADLYTFNFTDGTSLYLTSHDRTINSGPPYPGTQILTQNYLGQTFTFNRGPAIKRSGLTFTAGVKPAELKIQITGDQRYIADGGFDWQQAAARGLLDFAQVKLWRAIGPFTINDDGTITVGNVIPLFVGYIAQFSKISRYAVEFNVADARILMNVNIPKHVFTHGCKWTVYDKGCTLDPESFAVPTTILSVAGTQLGVNLPTQPSGYFDGGFIRWTSGANVGLKGDIQQHFAANQNYAAIVLGDSPIGYWRFNEPSGTTAYDISGNNNHGTLNGLVTLGHGSLLTSDPSGGSAFFAPTWVHGDPAQGQNAGGYVTLPIPSPKNFAEFAGGVTIEFIINPQYQPPSVVSSPAAVFDSAGAQQYPLRFWDSPGFQNGAQYSLTAEWLPSMTAGPQQDKVVGSPTHYMIVFRGSRTIDHYINGSLARTDTSGGSSHFSWGDSTSDFFVYSQSPNLFTVGAVYQYAAGNTFREYFYGNIAEFAIYPYAASGDIAFRHAFAATNPPLLGPNAIFSMFQQPLQPVAIGDTLKAYPACDWTVRTCRKRFNNIKNYGGYPGIPDVESSW